MRNSNKNILEREQQRDKHLKIKNFVVDPEQAMHGLPLRATGRVGMTWQIADIYVWKSGSAVRVVAGI